MSAFWTKEEEAILRAHYREVGSTWDGWETLLPGRTTEAIRWKAGKLKLADSREENRDMRCVDPVEHYILTCLRNGMTPSEVDKRSKWPPGRTKLILTEMWQREWSRL